MSNAHDNSWIWIGEKLREIDARIMQLEKHIHYPNSMAKRTASGPELQEAAIRAAQGDPGSLTSGLGSVGAISQHAHRADDHLYAPLRNDTKAVLDLAAFARRLLQYDDLGQQCSASVRDAAREALGMKKVES